jgi:hypothetical protein
MFDTIGRDVDEQATKRRALSLMMTLALAAAGVGFIVGVGVYGAAELVFDEVDEPMFEVALADDEPALPDLPGLPPPPAAAGVDRADAPEPTPDEPTDRVAPLQEPEAALRDQAPAVGQPDGVDGGDREGEPGGRPGGAPGGDGDGDGDGVGRNIKTFHHSELRARRRVDPSYPEPAKGLGLGEQRCKTIVHIDPDGVPSRVEVEGCPEVFHAETRAALLRWRWAPPRDGQRSVSAVTRVTIVYRLQ